MSRIDELLNEDFEGVVRTMEIIKKSYTSNGKSFDLITAKHDYENWAYVNRIKNLKELGI